MTKEKILPIVVSQTKYQERRNTYLRMWAELKGFEDKERMLTPIPIGIYTDTFEIIRLLSKEKEFGPILLDGYSEKKHATGLLINAVGNSFVNEESCIFLGTLEDDEPISFEGTLGELSAQMGGQARFLVSRVRLLDRVDVLQETTRAYERCISNMIEELGEAEEEVILGLS